MDRDGVLVGGPEKRAIEIVDYRPAWAQAFARERARIAEALQTRAILIEHVGSTAVPGLAAKPIVDILVSVSDPDDEEAFGPPLTAFGFELRVREPGHRMFRTPQRDVHVHVWAQGSQDERAHLVFRDWLRRSDADRQLYGRTKRELARHDWPDMDSYAEAKSGVVAEIMERAEAWAARSGWRVPGAAP